MGAGPLRPNLGRTGVQSSPAQAEIPRPPAEGDGDGEFTPIRPNPRKDRSKEASHTDTGSTSGSNRFAVLGEASDLNLSPVHNQGGKDDVLVQVNDLEQTPCLPKQSKKKGSTPRSSGSKLRGPTEKTSPGVGECYIDPFPQSGPVFAERSVNHLLDPTVVFSGGLTSPEEFGRGPKKKLSVDFPSPRLERASVLKAAEKRRALEHLDLSGCKLAERFEQTSDSESERDKARKHRDDSLNAGLKILSWNVRGLSRVRKRTAVKLWINKKARQSSVVALQEVKVENWGIRNWMKNVRRGGTVIYDPPRESKGDTALILSNQLKVLASGIGNNGMMAWASVQQGDRKFGVMSIHAPNRRSSRLEFWSVMREIIKDGDWCIVGDYNQVELEDDSCGKSTLIRGREDRMWKSMAIELGMVDMYFCSASLIGDRFTRSAKRGERQDRARLDRVYMTRGASWVNYIHSMEHGISSLSDHGPVIADCRFEAPRRGTETHSYFKMDVFELRDTETVREVLREARAKREAAGKTSHHLAEEVAWRKEQLNPDSTPMEVEALAQAEQRLKQHELYEARKWAKWAREALEVLEGDEGEEITEKEEILEKVHEFYQTLFSSEPRTSSKTAALLEVLDLVQARVSRPDNDMIIAVPDREEIENVVFSLPVNKAPGYDGLTIEGDSRVFRRLEQTARRVKKPTVEDLVSNRASMIGDGHDGMQLSTLVLTETEEASLEWLNTLTVGDTPLKLLSEWTWGRPKPNQGGLEPQMETVMAWPGYSRPKAVDMAHLAAWFSHATAC
ncbi:hypothetical protein R1sor_020765 [Riccia sorocarpa]|uniref:Endonuclease/exonuclease/phosphatase domain-containing protein n=1 Tax=Riccia sorocarpa TaxID=122646 RepID=A0ABD3GKT2_9MARC